MNVRELAGVYEVALVNTPGSWGPLELRFLVDLVPTDSTPTQRIGRFLGARQLHGRITPLGPERPAADSAIMIGLTFHLGGVDMVDGGGERLLASDFTISGFRGTWYYEGGIVIRIDEKSGEQIPDPKGIFCAWRRSGGGES